MNYLNDPKQLGQYPNVFVLIGYSLIVLFLCYIVEGKGRTIGKEKQEMRPFRAGEPIRASPSPDEHPCVRMAGNCGVRDFVKQVIAMLLILIIGGYLLLTHLTHQKEQNYLKVLTDRYLWNGTRHY